ncbi:MAG: hypothetical protein U0132_02255 [Gemmatimonadaceae bacterium]
MTRRLHVRFGLIAVVLFAVPVGRAHGQATPCPAADPGGFDEVIISAGQVAPAGLCRWVAPGTVMRVKNGIVVLQLKACGEKYVALSGNARQAVAYTVKQECPPADGGMTGLSQVATAHNRGEVFVKHFSFSVAPAYRCDGACPRFVELTPDAAMDSIRGGLRSDGTTYWGIVDETNLGMVCVNESSASGSSNHSECLHRASMPGFNYAAGPQGVTSDPLTWLFTRDGVERARFREVSSGPGFIRLFAEDTQENLFIDLIGMRFGSAGIGPAEVARGCQEGTFAAPPGTPDASTVCRAFAITLTNATDMQSVDGENWRRR